MTVPLGRSALLVLGAVVGCTTVLGIDGDYEPLAQGGATTSVGGATTSVGGAAGAGGDGGSGLTSASSCNADAECQAKHCVDGRCCAEKCNKGCEACSASKTGAADGTCTFIPAYEDPDTECGSESACDGAGVCNGIAGAPCNGPEQCISGDCSGVVCSGS